MIGSQPRRRAALAALFGTALVTAACAAPASGSSASTFLTSAQITTLEHLVQQASGVPAFVPPGPAFDTAGVRGKRLFVIPMASQDAACNDIAEDVVTLGGKLGMTGTNYQNSGGPAAWVPGIQQAISQHYDAIVLVCGIDPTLIGPQLQAAEAAGIKVIDSGLGDTYIGATQTSPLVTAQTNVPDAALIQRSVDVALLDNRGTPFDIFEIQSGDVPDGLVMDAALRTEIANYCPQCNIKSADISVPDWDAAIPSAVSTALIADPNIKAVIPIFDGEVPAAAAGIKASGRTNVKLYGDYGGNPSYILQMGRGLPMASDAGPAALWRAYATMDQTLRVLTGAGPVPPDKDGDPSRLFTIANYQAAGEPNDGFGTAFIAGYDRLWGIS